MRQMQIHQTQQKKREAFLIQSYNNMVFRSSTQLDSSYLGTLQQLELVPLFMCGSPGAIQSVLSRVRE